MPFYMMALLSATADQLTKYVVRLHLEIGESAVFWGMPLIRYENSGMALSLFQGYARWFAVAAAAFVIGVFLYRRTKPRRGLLSELGLGLLVGGAVGNGIDRVLFGQVTDFLVSRSGRGILNVADHAINAGLALVIAGLVIAYWKERRTAAAR